MILLDDVIQVFARPDLRLRANHPTRLQLRDSCMCGGVSIKRDSLRGTVPLYCSYEESFGGSDIPVLAQQEINHDDADGYAHDLTVTVAAGDALYFRVNRRTGTTYDGTSWDPSVEYLSGGAADVRWLVSDHLGTPRMVVDKTGALAGVSRHDYLPFGKELAVGIGARTTDREYGQADEVRQKFTAKERDEETGLDYFIARYYAPAAGRFTSCDPLQISEEHIADPQRWNLYAYVGNNPLAVIDPDGRDGLGQDGKRTITVFLNYAKQELDGGRYDSRGKFIKTDTLDKPDWGKLQKTAGEYGFELVVKDKSQGTMLEANSSFDFEIAAGRSELIVVAGHAGVSADGQVGAILLSESSGVVPADVTEACAPARRDTRSAGAPGGGHLRSCPSKRLGGMFNKGIIP